MKKLEGRFSGTMMAPMAALLITTMTSSLIQSVASSSINPITGKRQ